MTDWLRIHLAPLPLTSYALTGLFLLAALEFLGWRQPIRDGLGRACRWLIAKALALRSTNATVNHFTILGLNDPAAQEALVKLLKNAKRSGHRF